MSVLIYTETENGTFKKNAFEVASYGSKLAAEMGTEAIAVAINPDKPEALGTYGVNKVLSVRESRLSPFNARATASMLRQATSEAGASIVVTSSSTDAKYTASLLAGMLKAGYVNNVVSLPEGTDPLVVKRTAFSNKGFAFTELKGHPAIIGVSNNAFGTFGIASGNNRFISDARKHIERSVGSLSIPRITFFVFYTNAWFYMVSFPTACWVANSQIVRYSAHSRQNRWSARR